MIGRIFASQILGGLFSGGLYFFAGGGGYYRNFKVTERLTLRRNETMT